MGFLISEDTTGKGLLDFFVGQLGTLHLPLTVVANLMIMEATCKRKSRVSRRES